MSDFAKLAAEAASVRALFDSNQGASLKGLKKESRKEKVAKSPKIGMKSQRSSSTADKDNHGASSVHSRSPPVERPSLSHSAPLASGALSSHSSPFAEPIGFSANGGLSSSKNSGADAVYNGAAAVYNVDVVDPDGRKYKKKLTFTSAADVNLKNLRLCLGSYEDQLITLTHQNGGKPIKLSKDSRVEALTNDCTLALSSSKMWLKTAPEREAAAKRRDEKQREALQRVGSSSTTGGISDDTSAFVKVKGASMAVQTRLRLDLTVAEAKTKLAIRFPENSTDFSLFLEESGSFTPLQPSDTLGSYPGLCDGAKLRFVKNTWRGTQNKPVIKPAALRSDPSQVGEVSTPSRAKKSSHHDSREGSANRSAPGSNSTVSGRGTRKAPLTADAKRQTTDHALLLKAMFEELLQACKSLLLSTKKLKSHVDEQAKATDLFATAQEVAQHAMTIVSTADRSEDTILRDVARTVRTRCLDLIRAAQDVLSNPLDLQSKQRVDACSADLVKSLKELINVAETLNSSSTVQLDLSPEKAIQLTNSLVDNVMLVRDQLRPMTSASFNQDEDLFVKTTKTLVAAMNELFGLNDELVLDLFDEMKAATQRFVGAAKTSMSVNDQVVREQFTASKSEFQEVLRKFVLCATRTHDSFATSLKEGRFGALFKDPESSDAGSKLQFADPEAQAEYKRHHDQATKILDVLQNRFLAFKEQWTSQGAEQAEEATEAIIDVLYGGERPASGVRVVDEDEQAMRDLHKMISMTSATDWQQTSHKIKRAMTKLEAKARQRSAGMSGTQTLRQRGGASQSIQRMSITYGDTVIEFLHAVNDVVLLIQKAGSAVRTGSGAEEIDTNEMHEAAMGMRTAMQSLVEVFRSWLIGTPKQYPRCSTPRKTDDYWAIKIVAPAYETSTGADEVDSDDRALAMLSGEKRVELVSAKIPFLSENTVEQMIGRIVEKFPQLEENVEWGLFIPAQNLWLKPSATLSTYGQLKSPRAVLHLVERDQSKVGQRHALQRILNDLERQVSEARTEGDALKKYTQALADASSASGAHLKSLKLRVQDILLRALSDQTEGVHVLGRKAVSELAVLADVPLGDRDSNVLMQCIATLKRTVPQMQELLDLVQTYHFACVGNESSLDSTRAAASATENLFGEQSQPTDSVWTLDTKHPAPILKDGVLDGGTLDQLIFYLTDPEQIDTQFLHTFMATYHSFVSPYVLLQKLLQRFDVPVSANIPAKLVEGIRLRVGVVLKMWIEKHGDDLDEQFLETAMKFIETKLQGSSLKSFVEPLRNQVLKRRIEIKGTHERLEALHLEQLRPETGESGNLAPAQLFMMLNESEIARQLSLIEFNIFARIRPYELLGQAWSKPRLQHKSPNVSMLIARSNQLSFWVATMVIMRHRREDRAQAIEKFVAICVHLRKLRNYNSLMGLLAGLNMSAVQRLKFTWEGLSERTKADLAQISAVMSPVGSFKALREELVQGGSEATLPYLGTFLSDLTFTEDGNPDTLNNDPAMINMGKRRLIFKLLQNIQMKQQISYGFPAVEPIHSFMVNLSFLDEDELFELSMLREPRGAQATDIL